VPRHELTVIPNTGVWSDAVNEMPRQAVIPSTGVWSDAVNEVPRVGDEDVTSGVGRDELSDGDGGVAGRSGRSRFKDITKWKCQTRKRLRNSGQSYVSRNGVRRRPKLLKAGCGAKCRQRCHEQIPAEQRENLLHSFWQLGNLNSQRQYMNHTAKSSVKTKLHGTKKVSLKYFFHVDGQLLQVCKTFFLDTLSVSDQTVRTTLQKLTRDGHLLPDQRRQPASHKLQEATREGVRSHIRKFQTVPSHYCRHTSSKQYLPETLTLTEMYRLYVAECREENVTAAKKHVYFDIFHKDFNLAFHKPKMDMCDLREKY